MLLFQNSCEPVTEFASHHAEAKPAGRSSGKKHCYQCGHGRIQGGVWEMHPPPPDILKHIIDEYNFSIISNVFNNNKPHAQSTRNQKCTNKMHSLYLVKHLRCVYSEYDEIFRTYSDVGQETVRGYDVKLRHFARCSRIQSLGALQTVAYGGHFLEVCSSTQYLLPHAAIH